MRSFERSLLQPFGVNFFGCVSGYFGLAVASRNTLRALSERRIPVAIRDFDTRDGRSGLDTTYRHLETRHPTKLPHPVNLFHLNPSEVLVGIPILWPLLDIGAKVNAIVPFWELPVIPEYHIRAFDLMDCVLAPSIYIKDIIERNVPYAHVLHYPQAVYLPHATKPDRRKWALPAQDTVFLCSFDLNSDVNRKNPWAAIEAFRTAFPGDERVLLVVKLHGIDGWHGHQQHADRLRVLARSHPRIRLIEQRLDYDETLSLYASCDVLVHLHRAEGLGLVGMEMMSLGKPVVTTAWSGNMDYCTNSNSMLVGYEFVTANPIIPAYTGRNRVEGVTWANADVAEAARALRRLAHDPELRARLGKQAAVDMERRRIQHSRGQVADLLRQACAEIDPCTQEFRHRRRMIMLLRMDGARLATQRLPAALARRARRAVSIARRRLAG